jgi:FkbM family methyltransferase
MTGRRANPLKLLEIPTGADMKSTTAGPADSVIKSLVRRSWPYRVARKWREVRSLRGWDAGDEQRQRFYHQFVKPGDLVFDIGANLGNRTKVFLRLGARVVAFEPQSRCAAVLARAFNGHPSFRLVTKALGDRAGKAEMLIGATHVLSTMSEEWIDATTGSGRFQRETWSDRERVEVITFDEAIREFGKPSFSKVDVEGFESHVFAGLSQSVYSGSLEFAAEFVSSTVWCIERLAKFGMYRFQFSAGESMAFEWPDWLSLADARDYLMSQAGKNIHAWGDVYFRAAEVGAQA